MMENDGIEADVTGTRTPEVDNVLASTTKVMKQVMLATRHSNLLPKLGDNFELYSSYPIFNQLMELEGERVRELILKIYRHAGIRMSFPNSLDDQIDRLIDCNDTLLERIGTSLDEASGIRKKQDDIVLAIPDTQIFTIKTSWNKETGLKRALDVAHVVDKAGSSLSSSSHSSIRLLASKTVIRPQINFQHDIDNSNTPFKNKLKVKHNPIKQKSVKHSVVIDVDCDDEESMGTATMNDFSINQAKHPYSSEIEMMSFNKLWQKLPYENVVLIRETDHVPLKMIDSLDKLKQLCNCLKREVAFAVDLEHHSYRTFLGLTCLMQISTLDCDYLVDCLKLRLEMHLLNDPFTDPAVLKVFHGADSDVEWLQRDFGIYVVNMFDTGQAMRVLGYPKNSLAFLISQHCGKILDKRFQLADWRIRPLTTEMMQYAREDTHYLIHCYQKLHNELLAKSNEQANLLRAVFDRSCDVCMKVYEKPLFDEVEEFEKLIVTSRRQSFNNRQRLALQKLLAWRDRTARLEDESFMYVLPTHMALNIAEVLPREAQGVLACCNPIPPLVKQGLQELFVIVRQARDIALQQTLMMENKVTSVFPKRQMDSQIHCPHDLSHDAPFSSLSALDEAKLTSARKNLSKWLKAKPIIDLGSKCDVVVELEKNSEITPYERYILAIEMQQKQQIAALKAGNDQNTIDLRQLKPSPLNKEKRTANIDEITDESINVKKRKIDKKNKLFVDESNDQLSGSKEDTKNKNKKIFQLNRGKQMREPRHIEPFDYSTAKLNEAQPNHGEKLNVFDPKAKFHKKGKFQKGKIKNKNGKFSSKRNDTSVSFKK